MKHLNTYKIFEGIYQDTKAKIKELNSQKMSVMRSYFDEIEDCFRDLIDNYKTEYEENFDHLRYVFEIPINKYFEFFDMYEEVEEKLNGYIGKLPHFTIYYDGPCSGGKEVQFFYAESVRPLNRSYMNSCMSYKFIDIGIWDPISNTFKSGIRFEGVLRIKFTIRF